MAKLSILALCLLGLSLHFGCGQKVPVRTSGYAPPSYPQPGYGYPQPEYKYDANYKPGYDYSPYYPDYYNKDKYDYKDADYYGQDNYAQYPSPSYNKYEYGNDKYYNKEYSYQKYYKLDTCEYRFILDMVQCQETTHAVSGYSKTSEYDSSYNKYPTYQDGGFDVPNPGYKPAAYGYDYNDYLSPYYKQKNNVYSSTQYKKERNYYENQQYSNTYAKKQYPAYHDTYYPGPYHQPYPAEKSYGYDNYFVPSFGKPFYAPALDNQYFTNYYTSFRAANVTKSSDLTLSREYYRYGDYNTALAHFQKFNLKNVVSSSSSQSYVAKGAYASQNAYTSYLGYSQYFNYEVRLLHNHCTLAGYSGRHTCVIFTGPTHPYKKVERKFIYVDSKQYTSQTRYSDAGYGKYYD